MSNCFQCLMVVGQFSSLLSKSDLQHFVLDESLVLAFLTASSKIFPSKHTHIHQVFLIPFKESTSYASKIDKFMMMQRLATHCHAVLSVRISETTLLKLLR